MTSSNPATPLTRAEFRNSCTSVLQGLDCLFRQGVILDEVLSGALQELGTVIMNLITEIDTNREYFVDGPLVRYLTSQVSKGKCIIQEIKRTCSQKSAEMNGSDYLQTHRQQHLTDIQSVLEALNTFHQHTLIRKDTRNIEQQVQARISPPHASAASPPAKINMVQTSTNLPMTDKNISGSSTGQSSQSEDLKKPQNNPTVGATRSAPAKLGDSNVGGGGELQNSSIPGVFEHIHDVQTAGKQPHSDSWPNHQDVPPRVMENTKLPLVYSGLRDVHNYRNLPQFTGLNLPIPNLPSGELGHRASHTQHWGHTNKHVF